MKIFLYLTHCDPGTLSISYHRTWSSLVQVMDCCLFGNKSLPKPTYCQLNLQEDISVIRALGIYLWRDWDIHHVKFQGPSANFGWSLQRNTQITNSPILEGSLGLQVIFHKGLGPQTFGHWETWWYLGQHTRIFSRVFAFENVICKIATILWMLQCVNSLYHFASWGR